MMRVSPVVLLMLCAGLLNSCVATAIVGGAAMAGSAAYDERSLKAHSADIALSSKIEARLIAEKDMPSRHMSVEVIEGEVILTGYLPSQAHINRAVFICKNEKGVKKVRSELHIGKPTLKSFFSDTAITAAVKTKLLGDEFVKSFSIHVETVNGKVYLQGVVEDIEQVFRAKMITRKIKGVSAVVNLLKVQKKK